VSGRAIFMLLVFAAALAALAIAPGLTSPAHAADRGDVFQVGGDVSIAEDDSAGTIVAIGGAVDVAGTVRESIVAVGGDVRLRSTAVVGSQVQPADPSIILVGGSLIRDEEAEVQGQVTEVTGGWAGNVWDRGVVDPVVRPFRGFSLVTWLGGTLLYLLGAVIIAALAPRQIDAVRDRTRHRFWPSLGWGALGLIIIVPLIAVLLAITIIGLLAIPAWLFVVMVMLVIGGVGVAVVIGDWLLPRLKYRRENLMLAAIVGVVVLRLVALIPVAGAIVTAVAWLVGFGAALIALWEWQRRRREHGREVRGIADDRAA
jgi:hypothetical protein